MVTARELRSRTPIKQVRMKMAAEDTAKLASLKAKPGKVKAIGQKLGIAPDQKDQKAASDTLSFDDSTDKVINGATVNQAKHQGGDINIADKQPSEIRE